MRLLVDIMIYAGSALMIYNIYRYGAFVKSSGDLEHQRHGIALLIVPLLLLVFFLVGYVVVAVSGIADLLMAAILLGGSIFVFLLLTVMYSIIDHIRDTDKVLTLRYDEMRDELHGMTEDSLAAFLINLTRDEVEERAGSNLYESDFHCMSYTELLHSRGAYVIDPAYAGPERSRIRREELLRLYQEGQTHVSEVLLTRGPDEVTGFVQIDVTLTKMPISGDVVAFLVEKPYNVQMVRDALLERVLMDEFDRIAYLVDGKYHVLISNAGRKTGLLIPTDEEDDYESIYFNVILPILPKDRDRNAGPNPLRLSVINKAMEENEVYEINAPFVIDGLTRYKHILFYRIDLKAKFYLMLISDSTSVQEEQMAKNKQLSDALAEALRSNEARIRFFTNMSHDLRTPMNGILGFTGLAMNENDPQKLRDYLSKVDFSGRRLLSLMDDLFAMSLIDSGKLQLNDEPTDLRALAEGLRETFEAGRGEKNLSFLCSTEGLTAPVVFCDGQRLRQMLSRLMENACAFAPKNSVVGLSVKQLPSEDTERGNYEFHINNRGIHIPDYVLEHVFETDAWEQSRNSDELPGVGLGMAVTKAFVDLMGGEIKVSTDAQDNADFVIRLSFPAASSEPEAADGAEHAEGMELHILLVDDNEINREIADLMLSAEGWTVEEATDGAEAVAKVRDAEPGHFNVVLMDVQMPVMNGYQATAAIRALPDPEKAALPIIAVTANAYQEDANEATAAGMDGYVTKPIDPAVIRSVVGRVLGERAQGKGPKEGAMRK